MAVTKYTRNYDFDSFQASYPTTPLPSTQLEGELDEIKTVTDAIIDSLALIQRDDGELANASVHVDAFTTGSLALMAGSWTPKGDWATSTAYIASDVVTHGGVTYTCTTAHTSGTFATDLAADKWLPFSGSAAGTTYDNSTSGLTATDVQAAIDEIQGSAAKIDYDPAVSGLAATTVKAALDEIDGNVDTNTAAIAALSAGLFDTVATLTTGTTNVELTDDGKLYLCDTSGGSITINLPAIGSSEGVRFGFKKTSASNSVTIARDGTDTIDGGTSYTLSNNGEYVVLVADDATPDNWISAVLSDVPAATTSLAGKIEIATDAEVAAGTDTARASTPASIAAHYSTITRSRNADTTTSLTLALTDKGDVVSLSNASAVAVTIPTNASVPFDTNTQIDIVNLGAGTVTVSGDTGVTVNGVSAGSFTLAQHAGATILKVASDTWVAPNQTVA